MLCVNISEIHPTLGFTEFDILEKYRKSFKKSKFGRLHSVSYTHLNQERFGDRRQKIQSKAKTSDSDRRKEKDDYDGTDDTLRTDSVEMCIRDRLSNGSLNQVVVYR